MTEYKGYRIYPDGTFGHLHIMGKGAGMIPAALRGAFTTRPAAQKAIDIYLAQKGDKNETKAKGTSTRSRRD